jgi:hypothetical protein
MKYAWAQNRLKLERALGELGPEASEEAIKARYVEMAGKVLNDDGTVLSEVKVQEIVEETPKKTKKK